MAEEERYAVTWHGIFPRFLIAGFAFSLVGYLLQELVEYTIPITPPSVGANALPFEFEVLDLLSAVFPVMLFVLFYLVSRVRINLGSDYAAVAASIFAGALIALFILVVPQAVSSDMSAGSGPIDGLLQASAGAVAMSLEAMFVGFAAVLFSYRRRM